MTIDLLENHLKNYIGILSSVISSNGLNHLFLLNFARNVFLYQ